MAKKNGNRENKTRSAEQKRTKQVYRSSVTGEFVSDEEAAKNPKETYLDTVEITCPEELAAVERESAILARCAELEERDRDFEDPPAIAALKAKANSYGTVTKRDLREIQKAQSAGDDAAEETARLERLREDAEKAKHSTDAR